MRKIRMLAPLMAGALALAACTGGPSGSAGAEVPAGDGTIVVTSLWGGTEQEAFEAVLDAFKE